MSIRTTLPFIWNHPLNRGRRLRGVGRFVAWQLRSNLTRGPHIVDFAGEARLSVRRKQTGATGNIYLGLHEFTEMAFAVHASRPGDLFVDVGANVGSYTILVAVISGADCLSIEPSPEAYAALLDNVLLNEIGDKVRTFNVVIGSESGQIATITTDYDSMNFVTDSTDPNIGGVARVPMRSLDDLFSEESPFLIKADIEGYEGEMLKGAGHILKRDQPLALILETNGSGARYGYRDEEIALSLAEVGFHPHRYLPFERRIERLQAHNPAGNTIYINRPKLFSERVEEAAAFLVLGREV